MNNEEKIIDRVMMIDQWKVAGDIYTQDELNAIGELLDLYKKEQEKNKKIEDKKEEAIAIARANYILGQTEERSQWYKKINEISKEYQEKMKNDKDCKNIFNANNIRQEVITVLNNRLIGKEE